MAVVNPAPLALTATSAMARLRKDRALAGTLPLKAWLPLLSALAREDKKGDSVRGWVGGLAIGGGILSFVLLVSGALVVLLPMLAVEAALIVAYLRKRRSDLANHLRSLVVPLLRVLRQDAAADADLDLALRLQDRFEKVHFKEKRGIEEVFLYPYFTGRLRLADGAHLEIALSDEARRFSVTKRGSSGKTKTKTKYRILSQVSVRLGAPVSAYRLAPVPPAGAAGRVTARSTDKRHVITAEQSFKYKAMDAVVSVDDVLRVVALSYRMIVPAASSGPGKGA